MYVKQKKINNKNNSNSNNNNNLIMNHKGQMNFSTELYEEKMSVQQRSPSFETVLTTMLNDDVDIIFLFDCIKVMDGVDE